jgi:predicted TIM-barrel fold metal-dependent hydrolase
MKASGVLYVLYIICDRCVFASNFPVDRVNGTFDQMVTALNEALKGYSEEDKKKVFSENGKKFYRL